MALTERGVTLPDITQGDDVTFDILFEETDGTAIDITDWTVWLTIKESRDDADSEALIQQTVTSHDAPSKGQTSVTFAAADTDGLMGNKHWDLQYKNRAGDTRTPVTGVVYFGEEITNT